MTSYVFDVEYIGLFATAMLEIFNASLVAGFDMGTVSTILPVSPTKARFIGVYPLTEAQLIDLLGTFKTALEAQPHISDMTVVSPV